MTSIAGLLGSQPCFAGMSRTNLARMADCSDNVDFAVDERLLQANAPADRFYVLRSGKVAIEIETTRRGPMVIETISAGDIVGVSWLLPPYRWAFDARAVEATSAVVIDAISLRAMCEDDSQLGYDLYKRFAGLFHERLIATRIRLLDIYGRNDS